MEPTISLDQAVRTVADKLNLAVDYYVMKAEKNFHPNSYYSVRPWTTGEIRKWLYHRLGMTSFEPMYGGAILAALGILLDNDAAIWEEMKIHFLDTYKFSGEDKE